MTPQDLYDHFEALTAEMPTTESRLDELMTRAHEDGEPFVLYVPPGEERAN